MLFKVDYMVRQTYDNLGWASGYCYTVAKTADDAKSNVTLYLQDKWHDEVNVYSLQTQEISVADGVVFGDTGVTVGVKESGT